MNLYDVKKSFYSALIFFSTIMVLSIGYGALFGGLTTADKVGSGSGLTATSWNRIVDGVLNIDSRLSNLSFSGGNVGIGTASPGATLDVNGILNATAFRGNGASLTTINPSNISVGTAGISITGSAGGVPWSGVSGKPFNWAGQGGQPSWLWGSNDGANYYVWNPSNFSVNYANSAGSVPGTGITGTSLNVGGWIITEKGGNNGSVSCDTFCQGFQWAGWVGTCVAAINGGNNIGVPCSTITNVNPLRCLCAKF